MSAKTPAKKSFLSKVATSSDLCLTFGFFGIIILLVLPIPTSILDFLLALSIALSLGILLLVMYIKEPSDFSVFPVILLVTTLFRLGLNVASTRLILLDGYAGHVIESFGSFVVRGNYVVGAVIFLILVVINFVVITKGAGRIAEVAARFMLDSLPGKQMSIDAELNAGIIEERTATKRRLKLQQETDFYGAMDGASKFVRGDAIAGILITVINVVGGIAIGVFQKGMPLAESLQKFTLLSIGDGLVSQIPALIVSIGSGILITRTSEGSSLGQHIGKQVRVHPQVMKLVAVMLFIFAILPGMPFFPFMLLSVLSYLGSSFLKKHKSSWAQVEEEVLEENKITSLTGNQHKPSHSTGSLEDLKSMIQVDLLSVQLSYSLIPLADKKNNGDLLDRITSLRQKFAKDLGLILPPISVSDNLELPQNHYRFLLRGKELSSGSIIPHQFLAVNVSDSKEKLPGLQTKEPVFGLDATWILEDQRQNADANGFTTVDALSVLITHLTEIIKENAFLILEREDVQKLLDLLKQNNPTLINELIPDKVSVGLIQRVLQNLLQEKIPIKNLSLILETIADFADFTKNPDDLSEQVRKKLGIYFIPELEVTPKTIQALTLDPSLENLLVSRIKRTQFDVGLMMDPDITRKLLSDMKPKIQSVINDGLDPIIITISELRLPFKRFFDPTFPKLSVIAYQELPPKTKIQNLASISIHDSFNDFPLNQELEQALPV